MHLVRDDVQDVSDNDFRGLRSLWRRLRSRRQKNQEISKQQTEIGKRFFRELSEHVHMFSDEKYRVDAIPKNFGTYSIIIGKVDQTANHMIECDRPYRGRQIVLININYGRKGFLPISIIKGEYNISLDGPPGEPFWRCDDEETISDTIRAICSIFDCYIKSPNGRRRASK